MRLKAAGLGVSAGALGCSCLSVGGQGKDPTLAGDIAALRVPELLPLPCGWVSGAGKSVSCLEPHAESGTGQE